MLAWPSPVSPVPEREKAVGAGLGGLLESGSYYSQNGVTFWLIATPQLCFIPHTHPLRAFCDRIFHSFTYSHSLLPSNPTGPSFLCNHPRFSPSLVISIYLKSQFLFLK